jgi:adenine deaminase
MLTTPSCVPSVPGFEDTGAKIDARDIAETMKWDCCVGLGEMMNFPGILGGMSDTHDIVAETTKAGKIVTGHYSMPETGRGLNAYIASGARCCHESTTQEQAIAKMRLGMYAMLREGSAWHDLHAVAPAITRHEVDSRFACLVSDDAHPKTIYTKGHIDHILRRALEEGIDAITAIHMVTINCAQCFQMDHELGSITPGKCADLVLLEDLQSMKVRKVWIDGNLVADRGQMTEHFVEYQYPDWATHSIHIDPAVTQNSFRIPVNSSNQNSKMVKVHAIEIIPERVGTIDTIVSVPVQNGLAEANLSEDILKAAVFERHHDTGKVGLGFVKGFGIRRGAMASTVAHDAHNLLVIGTNDEDMQIAASALVESEGGMAVVADGELLGRVELPIAGLMNDLSCEEMSRKVDGLESAWEKIGCEIESPFMTMALIALACIPEIRLTDRGLVDCRTFTFMNLFAE